MDSSKMPALGRALRVLGEHGDAITLDTPPEVLAEIRGDLQRAADLLAMAEGPRPLTDCREHPNGAVDPEQPTPPGTPGKCLLCALRRRRGTPAYDGQRDALRATTGRRYTPNPQHAPRHHQEQQ